MRHSRTWFQIHACLIQKNTYFGKAVMHYSFYLPLNFRENGMSTPLFLNNSCSFLLLHPWLQAASSHSFTYLIFNYQYQVKHQDIRLGGTVSSRFRTRKQQAGDKLSVIQKTGLWKLPCSVLGGGSESSYWSQEQDMAGANSESRGWAQD